MYNKAFLQNLSLAGIALSPAIYLTNNPAKVDTTSKFTC
jgi:hypothetical protein